MSKELNKMYENKMVEVHTRKGYRYAGKCYGVEDGFIFVIRSDTTEMVSVSLGDVETIKENKE